MIKQGLLAAAIAFTALTAQAAQGDAMDKVTAKEQMSTWDIGQANTAYAKYFIGDSYLNPYKASQIGISNVTFDPGCRNNWHIHHKAEQTLVVVSGLGIYQEWGKDPVLLKPGMVVAIPPEVKHYHGAIADSYMQHLSITANGIEGASNDWLEPVDDEAYNKAHQQLGL